jgi:hydrogenase maturation protease
VTSRRVIIGIGNRERGDDAAGCELVAQLRGRLPPEVELLEQNGEAGRLLAQLEGAAEACIVDACAVGVPPGTIRRLDAASPMPLRMRECSTHGLGVAEALAMARALGVLPPHCVLYAIEGESYELGAPLSQSVRAAIHLLVEVIAYEQNRESRRSTPRG